MASNHKYQHTQQQGFKCDNCIKTFKGKYNYFTHLREKHELHKFSCNQCNYTTCRAYRLCDHKKKRHNKEHKTLENEVAEHSKHETLENEVVKHQFPIKIDEVTMNLKLMEESVQVFKICKLLQRMKNE